jgi:hypothetical protein
MRAAGRTRAIGGQGCRRPRAPGVCHGRQRVAPTCRSPASPGLPAGAQIPHELPVVSGGFVRGGGGEALRVPEVAGLPRHVGVGQGRLGRLVDVAFAHRPRRRAAV